MKYLILISLFICTYFNVNGQYNSAIQELESIGESLKEDAGSKINFGKYFFFSDPKDIAECKDKYISKASKKLNFILLKETISESEIEKISQELEGYVDAKNILIMKSEETFLRLDEILNSEKQAYYVPLDYNGNITFLVKM
jgi:hypothetical protein